MFCSPEHQSLTSYVLRVQRREEPFTAINDLGPSYSQELRGRHFYEELMREHKG
ncbi:hypothetical protein PAXRUDRAFT_831846 [Paxillus rubicundulus Ve08.2h10]|uniref:Unplaced genomic scaffold scaffold_723, whole genome shotgun sequence n=1 Tax=Paxillus rubicundulus Ve08.2h10 TaxID=930991 RepID=A0A0D0CV47_9AGAM|nr:hypothetical protein PAXRUDRAFT_831846 [Paxillus rubicundulus Ve08.2h10]